MICSVVHTDKNTLHQTLVKIDHLKIAEICPSVKRDSILKLVYLKKFLSDLSD